MENIERKPISGYEGLYDITSDGRVISLERHYVDSLGKCYFKSERYIGNSKDAYGYLSVSLTDRNGNMKKFKIHRLVADAFIPYTGLNPDGTEIKGRVEVNHKSEIKTDNRVENLEWCDRRYNNNYGTHNERVGRAQRKRILCIETNEIFFGMKEIYEKYKIPSSNIIEICNCGKQKSAKGLHFRYIEED